MSVTIDKQLGIPLDHKHKETDISGIDNLPNMIVDTEANILADATPANGDIGFATDTNKFYVYDGTNWNATEIRLTRLDLDPYMGAFKPVAGDGYLPDRVSQKLLTGVAITDTDRDGEGMLRVRRVSNINTIQVYLGGEWKNIRALSDSEVNDIIKYSDFDVEDDAYGRSRIHDHKVDMGAFASEHLLYVGEIT